MVVADVEEAACGGILRDAGELQQESLDRRVVATRQRLNGLLGHRARRCADGGEEVAAGLIEGFGFGIELRSRRDRLRSGRRCGRWRPAGAGAGGGAARTRVGLGFGFSFSFGAVTTTSGSWALRRPPGAGKASSAAAMAEPRRCAGGAKCEK